MGKLSFTTRLLRVKIEYMSKNCHSLIISSESRPIINSLEPIDPEVVISIIRGFRYIDADIRRLEHELGEDVEARIVRAPRNASSDGTSTRH